METLSRKPVRVLFLLPTLDAGGAERVMITLMNGLDRTRFSPSLVCVLAKGRLESLVHKDIDIKCLDKRGVFQGLTDLYRAIDNMKPHIVVSTMAHMNFAALMLRKYFPKTKFIVREAITPSFFFQRKGLFAWMVRAGYKYLYKRANAVIVPSQTILAEFKNLRGMQKARFKLLYNPVDTGLIESGAGNPNFDDTLKFVAAGRLHPQKGFDRLIEALENFKPAAPWRLDIWGDGEEEDALLALVAQKGLGNKITLRGHTENPWQYYATADCLLLPSRWEGLPNVALESLACGTPVIAMHEAGGIGEIAAKAEQGAVRIAHSMEEFTNMMAATAQKTEMKSLLPDAFNKDEIQKSFEELLLKK